MYKADFAELKSELHMLEKNDFTILKGENERLEAELEKVRAQMREDVNRLQGSVRLDMNLEKGRLRDEALVQESKIKDTENRIDTEISNVRTQLETLKFDIIKYIVGTTQAQGAAAFRAPPPPRQVGTQPSILASACPAHSRSRRTWLPTNETVRPFRRPKPTTMFLA